LATHAEDPAAPEPPPAAPPSTLGQTPHEPTVRPWELELLISGAVVFSLAQLPGSLDAWFDRLSPRLAGSALGALIFLYAYLKLILYTLIGSFLLHLCVRAYWVGMIGLESVFPRGVDWERSQSGPVGREVQRERVPPLQALIDRSDRFASVIFGFAFLVVVLFLVSIVYGGALWLLAASLSRLFFGGERTGVLLYVLLALFVVPGIVLALVDRRFGARLDPAGRPRRVLRALLAATYRLQGMALFAPTLLTLFTNLPRRRIYPVFFAILYAPLALFVVKDLWIGRGRITTDAYGYLPREPGRFGVERGFYEDKRAPGEVYTLPSIQSDVVREPYVRLFIPFLPGRHDALFSRACAGMRPFREGGLRFGGDEPGGESDAGRQAVLECWARAQPVTLNGRPLAVPFRFYTHPATGIRGVVAHIPTAGLPRGENVLTVARVPPARETEERAPPKERPPYFIPFWL
jgi:hypothetical protein